MPNAPHLDVFFRGITMHSWKSPVEYECRVFDCEDLAPAISLAWSDLPVGKVAAFYETADCTYSSTTFTFNTASARNRVNGYHRLTPPRMIRSMMLGRAEAALLDEKLSITKPTTSTKKTPKPTTPSKKTPKPTTANSKTKAPTTPTNTTEKPATLGKKKTTSKGTCTLDPKKQESNSFEETINSSNAVEWHSDESSFGGLSSNWSDPIH